MTSLEHRQVQANGIRLHVATAGDPKRPAVMFLHGFPEGWSSWRSIMEALADDYFVLAPDLRGYGQSDKPADGYGLMTLSDDIHDLVDQLTDQPITLVGQDWGGALTWIYGHRFGETLRQLVVVNCPHPHTFLKAVIGGQDWQRFRSSYMVFFQIPWLPETLLTGAGCWLLRRGFKLAEGTKGAMNAALVDELMESFRTNRDLTGPLNFYREFVRNQFNKAERTRLITEFARPIPVPCTLLWGQKDQFLSEDVARKSHEQAHCDVEWRPLPAVGHFVSMEAPDQLLAELRRTLPGAAISGAS
ncbi:MAG TPA: alpha/beta hydrolase [Vicinamibacteria bacterium]|nr:alpha/beta hydrolase [Vicinamibacteria bacterium]HRB12635.1 alpha/beta hydrolase [Vicinamibacteria bacterium]